MGRKSRICIGLCNCTVALHCFIYEEQKNRAGQQEGAFHQAGCKGGDAAPALQKPGCWGGWEEKQILATSKTGSETHRAHLDSKRGGYFPPPSFFSANKMPLEDNRNEHSTNRSISGHHGRHKQYLFGQECLPATVTQTLTSHQPRLHCEVKSWPEFKISPQPSHEPPLPHTPGPQHHAQTCPAQGDDATTDNGTGRF